MFFAAVEMGDFVPDEERDWNDRFLDNNGGTTVGRGVDIPIVEEDESDAETDLDIDDPATFCSRRDEDAIEAPKSKEGVIDRPSILSVLPSAAVPSIED